MTLQLKHIVIALFAGLVVGMVLVRGCGSGSPRTETVYVPVDRWRIDTVWTEHPLKPYEFYGSPVITPQAPKTTLRQRTDTLHDTTLITRVDTVTQFDTLHIVPFRFDFDTITQTRDTLNIRYFFPQNRISVVLRPAPAEIPIIRQTSVREPDFWEKVLWFSGGMVVGYGVSEMQR